MVKSMSWSSQTKGSWQRLPLRRIRPGEASETVGSLCVRSEDWSFTVESSWVHPFTAGWKDSEERRVWITATWKRSKALAWKANIRMLIQKAKPGFVRLSREMPSLLKAFYQLAACAQQSLMMLTGHISLH